MAGDSYDDAIVQAERLIQSPITNDKAKKLLSGLIVAEENAKKARIEWNLEKLAKIPRRSVGPIKQLVKLLPNGKIKKVHIVLFKLVKQMNKHSAEGKFSFAEYEKANRIYAKGVKKYLPEVKC